MWLHGEKCDISGISFVPPDFGYILASNFFQKRVVPLGSGSIDPLPIAVPSRPCWCVLNPCGQIRWCIWGEKCDISTLAFVYPDFGRNMSCNFVQRVVVPLGSGSIDPLPIAVPSRPCWCVLNPCGQIRWCIWGEKCDISTLAFVPPDFGRNMSCNFVQKVAVLLGSGSIDPLASAPLTRRNDARAREGCSSQRISGTL
jgi:hypothetical protein